MYLGIEIDSLWTTTLALGVPDVRAAKFGTARWVGQFVTREVAQCANVGRFVISSRLFSGREVLRGDNHHLTPACLQLISFGALTSHGKRIR